MSDDFGVAIGAAGQASVGGTATGVIEEAGDQDWFAISLTGGNAYQVDLEGSPTSAGTLSDTYIRGIYDASGNLLASTANDDSGDGLNSRLSEFVAPSSGTYYISAGAYSSNTGTYQLSVADLGAQDDFSSSILGAGQVSVGGSSTGEIEESGDQDWFEVSLTGGNAYQVDLEGSPTSAGTLSDTYIRGIYDASGNLLASTANDDSGDGLNSRLSEFVAPSSGTYYISAGAYSSNTGTYQLSVADLGAQDDFSSSILGAGQVSVGGSSTGEIEESGDQDWFEVSLTGGNAYQVDLEGSPTSAGTLSDTYIRGIYDASGNLLASTGNDDSGEGLNSRLSEFVAPSSGTYYISAGAYSSNTGTYQLSVADLGARDDFSSSILGAGQVSVGGSSTGEIEESGDQDWFEVSLTGGNAYQVDLEGSPTSAGTLSDTYIRGIYDASGNLLASTANDDSGDGLNSRLSEFVAPSSGTYYISAGAYSSNTGTYQLSVADLGAQDDFGEVASSAGVVSVGESSSGVIEEAGDQDWFAVSLLGGNAYQIDLEGSANGSDAALSDTYIRGIYDASGNLLSNTSDDDGGAGLDSQLEFVAPSSGIFYISAGAYSSNTGAYSLSVGDLGARDDFASAILGAGHVSVGGSSTGEIEESGDQDWFEVNLAGGNAYQIDLEGTPTSAGTLSDTYIRGIYDASGNLLASTANDDSGDGLNSRLSEFVAPSSGTYYISAGAYSSNTGTYQLSVADLGAQDDFGEVASSAGVVSVGESSSGVIEEAGDQDWFAVSLLGGNAYQVDLEGSANGSDAALSDTYIRGIYDASGNLLSNTSNDDGGAGLDSQLEFVAPSSGIFYISAGAYSSNTGAYSLSVGDLGARDDFASAILGAGQVSVDGSSTGEIEESGDQDWFEVNLAGGNAYQIDLEGTPTSAGTLSDTYIRGIYDASGNLLASTANDDSGDGLNSRLSEFVAPSSGTYYISAGAYSSNTGTYQLSVADLGAQDDFGEVASSAGVVSVGESSSGVIEEAGDQDWFAVSLLGGNAYQVDLEGSANGSDAALSDTYIRGIYDASGNLLSNTSDDDGGAGLDSQLEFVAPSSGIFYISAGAYSSNTGAYSLSVGDLGARDDFASAILGAGQVSVDGSSTGEIEESGDQDWFEVNLAGGNAYQIDLEGTPTSAGTLSDTYIRGIYDASGNLLASTANDDSGDGLNSRLSNFIAPSSGTYYISAGAYSSNTGSYQLSVADLGAQDDFTAAISGAGQVAVDGSSTGVIEQANDQDWFAVSLLGGNVYQVDLEGSANGSDAALSDTYIRGIYDASGTLLSSTSNDDGGAGLDSQLEFVAPSSGIFYISAGAYGSHTGAYSLSVSDGGERDDFSSAILGAGHVSVDGSSTGEIEESYDQDWFEVSLTGGNAYQVDLEGSQTNAGTLSDTYIRGIYDASGNLLSSTTNDDSGEGLNSRLSNFIAPSSGTYYISAGAYSSNTGSYQLSVADLGAQDDFTAAISGAGHVSVDGSSTGVIEQANDQDWFAVSLLGGNVYQIDLEGSANGSDAALNDTYIRGIYDANGNLLSNTSDDDGGAGLDSQLEFVAPSNGVFYISAGAYGSHTGAYSLSVSDGGERDDFGTTILGAGRVSVDGSSTGVIEQANDQDWFAVSLVGGAAYQIDLEGSVNGSDPALRDTYIRGIYDANGNLLSNTSNDDGGVGLNSQLEFVAPSNGVFYISAGAYSSNTGGYQLSVAGLIVEDDFNNGIAGSGRVSVGGSSTGVIEESGDQDWFEVNLTGGNAYQIDLEGSANGGDAALSDTYIRGIYDANGSLLSNTSNDDGGVGLDSQLGFIAPSDGTYYISAGAYSSNTGAYRLSVSDGVLVDDYAQTASGAGQVIVDGVSTGEIEATYDQDWFAVDLIAGSTYQIDLEGSATSAGSLSDPYLRGIYDSSNNLIADTIDDDGGVGLNSQLDFTASATGTYYIDAAAYSNNTGTYSLSVRETSSDDADDFSAGISGAGQVAVDGSSSGSIEIAGDQDWFAISLESSEIYRIDLEGSATSRGSLNDTYLRGIYDASGNLISNTTDDDSGSGLNSQLEFSPSSDGTYYISAGAYSSNIGTYRLSVDSLVSTDDYSQSTDTAGLVVAGESITGVVERANDQDWFAVDLIAGSTYQVDLEGSPTNVGTLSDTYLRGIYDASGVMVSNSSDDDSGIGFNSQLEFIAPSTGTFYVAAGAYSSNTGSYKLSVSAGVAEDDDYLASTETTGTVNVGGIVTGVIEQVNDQDWFAVSLTSGSTYQIDLEGSPTNAGTLSDTYLRGIYDASGNLMSSSSNDDSGVGYNSQLEFLAPTTGTFYVAAGAFGNNTGSYKLSVEGIDIVDPTTPDDDYLASTATSGSVSVGGIVTGTIEQANDQDWFAVTLTSGTTYQIDLEGSPTNAGTLSDTYLRGIYDDNGNLLSNTSNDDDGAGYNSQLDFTAPSSGVFYISAGAYSSNTGTYKLSVDEQGASNPTAPESGGEFNIEINFDGDAEYLPVFQRAAERWEEIITDDITDVQNSFFGFVDDLLIDASVASIDGVGGILGQAGGDAFRSSSNGNLPYHGVMHFDMADMADMEEKGILEDVILHEMGHVLGFTGHFFEAQGLLASTYSYNGSNAVEAYGQLLGNSTVTTVPLETGGGGGTAGSHWAESVFNIELMTGYAENRPPMPISIVTIGAFEDLGYTVNYAAADDFTGLSNLGSLSSSEQMYSASEDVSATSGVAANFITSVGANYNGTRFEHSDNKALEISAASTAGKLEGVVTFSDEYSISFIETDSGNDYFIQLEGSFEKDNPEFASDIKGFVTSVTVLTGIGGEEVTSLNYQLSIDIDTVLDDWYAGFISGSNYIVSTSEESFADSVRAGNGRDIISLGGGNDYLNGGRGNDRLYGDANRDRLIGGRGNDLLDGGSGRDTLIGGQGNDSYVVDNVRDRVIENAGQGTDLVTASVTHTLADNVEQLTLAGNNNLNGTGNNQANVIQGNRGRNVLTGMSGRDRLIASAGRDVLRGNSGRDRLIGGNGNDTLSGGRGADTLIGGRGRDRFDYTRANEGGDTIVDFNRNQEDTVRVRSRNFGGLAIGTLSEDNFVANTSGMAQESDDFFVFNTSNSTLYYDADGSGSQSRREIASFSNDVQLRHTDITIA